MTEKPGRARLSVTSQSLTTSDVLENSELNNDVWNEIFPILRRDDCSFKPESNLPVKHDAPEAVVVNDQPRRTLQTTTNNISGPETSSRRSLGLPETPKGTDEPAKIDEGRSFVSRHKCLVIGGIVFMFALVAFPLVTVFMLNKLRNGSKYISATLLSDIPGNDNGPVNGLTVLNEELFVIQAWSPNQVIIYNTSNYTQPPRFITIPGSSGLWVVGSSSDNCLYISDLAASVMFHYSISTNVTTNWSLTEDCYGLSLISINNVFVTLHSTKQIIEYAPDGSFIREISLDRSIDSLWHCVQLSGDRLVVSHGWGGQHRVCVIDMSGRIIQCYGGTKGAGAGQLNNPRHLAVDRYDNVLIADWGNDRIVVLTSSMSYLGYITIEAPEFQLSKPWALHLDKLNHRLYIGDTDTGRVCVLSLDDVIKMSNKDP